MPDDDEDHDDYVVCRLFVVRMVTIHNDVVGNDNSGDANKSDNVGDQ